MRKSGGENKTHGQIERADRIDSFEAGTVEGRGTLFAWKGDSGITALDCLHGTEYGPEREIIELSYPGSRWRETLELTRINNGFGGKPRAFWLCPLCGRRVRYLYFKSLRFMCRKCAALNYRSQQETRSDCMYYYNKGMTLVDKRLDARLRPDGFSFCDWIPDRPRYMHKTTYQRYLRRFLRYQKLHTERQMEDIARILKLLK